MHYVGRSIAAATLAASLAACGPSQSPEFSAQYITLPSGAKAYCNRQGYREVQRTFTYETNQMVTDPKGNFVKCDARVGPEWDKLRTDPNGKLLTSDEINAIATKRAEEERARQEIEGNARREKASAELAALQAAKAGYQEQINECAAGYIALNKKTREPSVDMSSLLQPLYDEQVKAATCIEKLPVPAGVNRYVFNPVNF